MSDGNISKISLPDGSIYDIKDNTSGFITGMTILSYGSSTYAEALAAYQANRIIYCRASSNSNPSTGNQLRMAFLAYVNNQTTPTEFEFQYYRSVSTHTASQQGDQVYVYKLNSSGTWSVTVREAYTKVATGTGLTNSYSSGTFTSSLANTYGDTKNPYGTKTANYVLAGPASGNAAAPSFRALVANDIPDLSDTYLTSFTETDPTVPSWAKADSKPSYNFSEIGNTPTTLSGYGITDANISNGVITLGSNTITPLTSSSTLSAAKLSGAIPSAVTATTQAATDNSTKIATTAYVTTAISNLPDPMIFKGSVGTGGTITSLPAASSSNEGYTYKVITDLSTPVVAKIGDTVISNGSLWIVIPSGDEPSGTVTSVGLSNASNGGLTISGSPITSSGSITVGHSNVLTSAQTTQAVYPIKIDKNGHISGYGTAVTIPTKVSDLTNDSGFVTTDNKLEISSVSNGSYYPIVASNSTTAAIRQYDNTGFEYLVSNGTTSTRGYSRLTLGNSTSVNTAGNKEGIIRLYGQYTGYADISLSTYTTSGRTITIPDASGTIALTSNINDATLTIQKNGVNVETFSANASSNKTANIVVNEVPSGGTTGQALVKNSATNYDVSWADVTTTAAQIIRWTEST